MMDFIKFENKEMGILVGLIGKIIEFWAEYEKETMVGTFHDNNPINLKLVSGMTAQEISEADAFFVLKKISNATKDTVAGKYALEIDEYLQKLDITPFCE